MGMNLAYPARMGGTAQEQINAIYRSQCEVIDRLNLTDFSAESVLQEITQGINEDAALKSQQEKNRTGFASLKQLIIKTADFAMEESETFQKTFSGSYVAKSEFGEYTKKTDLTLSINSEGITQLYDFTDGINNVYTGKSQQYVKTGLLYYDLTTPQYGVAVGNIETVTVGQEETISKTAGEVVVITPGRMTFWQSGAEVGYMSGGMLHFPSGKLEAKDAQISGQITATKLTITEDAEISGLYLEKFKLRGQLPIYHVENSVQTLAGELGTAVDTDDDETKHTAVSLTNAEENGLLISSRRSLLSAYGGGYSASVSVSAGGAVTMTATSEEEHGVKLDYRSADGGFFAPTTRGETSLGRSGRLWRDVWAEDDVIQTSDRNKKHDIDYDMTKYAALFDGLKVAQYRLNSGTSGRVHLGMIAQDVEQALQDAGLTGQDFGGFVRAGNETDGYDYFLRYGEFIPLCIDQIQRLKKRVEELEQ